MLRTMENEDYSKLLDSAFQFQLALVSNGNLGSDNFTKVQKEAKEIFQDIEGEVRPWLGRRTREERARSEFEEYDAMWEEATGFSMRDAEAVENWNDTIKEYVASEEAAADEERKKAELPDKLFAERVEAIKKKRQKQQGR